MTPDPGDGLTPRDILEVAVRVTPIVIAVIIATIKIIKVLREEIRGEIGPIMDRFDKLEKQFIDTVRTLWEHNSSQDIKIDAVIASHNRLRGAHDAIVMMGGHGEGKTPPGYSGPERRKEERPPKCSGPG